MDQVYDADRKELLIRKEALDAYGERIWEKVNTTEPGIEWFEP